MLSTKISSFTSQFTKAVLQGIGAATLIHPAPAPTRPSDIQSMRSDWTSIGGDFARAIATADKKTRSR